MEIVIKIHDIPTNNHERWILKYGIPLPKHHGNLKDVDKMMAHLCKDDCKQTNGECKYFTRCSFWDAVQEAETIIPATKEQNIQGCSTCCFAKQCQLREHLYRSVERNGCTEWKEKEQSCSNCQYYPNTAPCDSCDGYSNYNEWQTATKEGDGE